MPANPKLKVPLLLAFLMALSGCTTIEPYQVPEYDGSMSRALNVTRAKGIHFFAIEPRVLKEDRGGESSSGLLRAAR